MRGAVEVPLFGSPDVFAPGDEVWVDPGLALAQRHGHVVAAVGSEQQRRYRVRMDDGTYRVLAPRFLRGV